MPLSNIINNLIDRLLNNNSNNTFIYEAVDETLGKMTPHEVLEKIADIITKENLALSRNGSLIQSYIPILMENVETQNRHWQVTLFYNQLDWKICKEGERKEYCWIIVDDETGDVLSKIPAR